jgi:hypothetical protein
VLGSDRSSELLSRFCRGGEITLARTPGDIVVIKNGGSKLMVRRLSNT